MSTIEPKNNEVYEALSFGDPRVCLVATNRESDAKVAIVKSYDKMKGFVTADNQYSTCVRLIKSAEELDSVAVDILADDMKKRLDKKRDEGRRGWHTCSEDELSNLLTQSLEKGNPVDIANFCAFLLARGFTYKAPKQA